MIAFMQSSTYCPSIQSPAMRTRHDTAPRPASIRQDRERIVLLAARSLVDRMRRLYRELEQMTGAPISMHRALTAIGEHPGIQASHLAVALGMNRPAVSQVVTAMVERGWIERIRPASDQRAVQLFPTSIGLKVLKATAGRAVATLQRSVRELDDVDLHRLELALPALLSSLPDQPSHDAGVRTSSRLQPTRKTSHGGTTPSTAPARQSRKSPGARPALPTRSLLRP